MRVPRGSRARYIRPLRTVRLPPRTGGRLGGEDQSIDGAGKDMGFLKDADMSTGHK